MENNEEDTKKYAHAVKELMYQPVMGSSGTYHVKNGIIHCGYNPVSVNGFAVSQHFWEIMH